MKNKYIIFFIFSWLLGEELFFQTIKAQNISTVVGVGTAGFSGDGGVATLAELNSPSGVDVDAAGNIYIADQMNNRIRKMDANTGIIITIAGTGTAGFSGDGGPATAAQLYRPYGVAIDAAGNVFIADFINSRFRKIDIGTGIINTIVGNGTAGYNGDGIPATSAALNDPLRIAFDASGNIFIADALNHRVRKVAVGTGIITTIAGTGTSGYNGDGILATSARLNFPHGIAVDANGNIYIGDKNNYRVRKIDVGTGLISTVAGTGVFGSSGDGGDAIAARLGGPDGIAVDGEGNIYIADESNHRVRKIDISTGIINTIAGTGVAGFSGDGGPATSAKLYFPSRIAIDASCNIYISDLTNQRIRKIGSTAVAPVLTVSAPVTVCAGNTVILTAGGGYSYQWNTGETTDSINVNPVATTLYTVKATGQFGCGVDNDTVMVTVNPLPVPVITGDTSLCFGDTTTLTANGADNYLWSTGSTGSIIKVNPISTTVYTIVGSDTIGCIDSSVVTVNVHSLPTINAGLDDTICMGQKIPLNASGGINYLWTPSTGLNTTTSSMPIASPLNTIIYTLTGSDANGCINTDSIKIVVEPSADATFTIDPTNGQIPLTVNYSNTSTNATMYEWSFGDNSNSSTEENPVHVYTEGGEFAVQLIANNLNNCPDTAIYHFVKVDATSALWIPNTFTPNNNATNDKFTIYSLGILEIQAYIYNRWGELIYQWSTLNGGWDGTYKEAAVQEGVYIYVVKAKGIDNVQYKRIGHVSLIK